MLQRCTNDATARDAMPFSSPIFLSLDIQRAVDLKQTQRNGFSLLLCRVPAISSNSIIFSDQLNKWKKERPWGAECSYVGSREGDLFGHECLLGRREPFPWLRFSGIFVGQPDASIDLRCVFTETGDNQRLGKISRADRPSIPSEWILVYRC